MAGKNNNSQGAPAQGLSDIEGLAALIESLESVDKKSKQGSKDLDSLNKRMATLAKEAKRSKDPLVILTKSFSNVKSGSKEAGDAMDVMAKQIEESVGVMTSSSSASLNQTIEGIKKMQAELVASGKGNSRENVMLNSKRSQLEMARFKDEKNFMIERAKLMQSSGNPLKMLAGAGFGAFHAGAKNALVAAEALGGALGLTAGVMMLVTQVLIAVTLPFMAFILVAKKSAKMMADMAEAGDTMSGSVDGMRTASTAYFTEVSEAAAGSNMTFKQMQELMVAMNHEYGRSLGLGANFVGTIANVGRTFGMANEESVKLATKIAVLSRTTSQAASQKAFTFLGIEAAKLKLPMDALAEPMMNLAELAGKTGHSVNSAADSLALMIQSVESLKTSGIAVFKNMQPADVAKFTKEFSGFMTGIDEWMLAAMSFKDNESFQGMTERVAGMNTKDRVNAIGQLMKDNELFGPQHSSELGMVLGAKSPSEALQRGKIAQAAVSGEMNDSQYNSLMAKDINRQLSERKTAGEAIQFGTDPTAFMMDRVQRILDTLVDIQGVIAFWKGVLPGSSSKSGLTTAAAKAPASKDYGASAVASKRPNLMVPLGS